MENDDQEKAERNDDFETEHNSPLGEKSTQCLENSAPVHTYLDRDEINSLRDEHKYYLLNHYGTLDLDPIPDLNDADPYNWPNSKKLANLVLIAFHAIMAPFTAASIQSAFESIVILGGAPLLWRPLSNRFGRRPIFLVSLICSLVGNVGCANSHSYATMALCRAIVAFFICPPAAIGSVVVTETFFKRDPARYMGIWTLLTTIDVPVSPFIFGSVAQRVNYRGIFYVLAINHRNLFAQALLCPLADVLPPGVNQQQFDRAFDEFEDAVGKENSFRGQALEEYVDPYELWEEEGKRKMPSAAVCPSSMDELRAALKVANKFSIPVWTFSRGKNLGYGGPAPRLNGSVALDLHRMNKIIEVNDEFSYAVVEPGVTFTDLYLYCVEHKLRILTFQRTVDRGTGFTPTATHHQHISGMEIMLADGDLVRTGQFAISNSPSAHLSKFSFGPSIEGLFLQSNLGIVTKMGIWLHPQPQAYMSCTFDMPNFEDVEVIVDIFGSLRRDGLLPNTVYVSNIVEWLGMTGKRAELWPQEGPIPDWRLCELQKQLGFGYWNVKFGLYGAKGVVQSHFDELKRIIGQKAPGSVHRLQGHLFSAEDGKLLEATSIPDPHGGFFVGVPSLWSLPMTRYRLPKEKFGIGAHADYSPIIPSDGKKVLEWVKTARGICEGQGFDLFCDFFMHERHLIFVNMMVFDKANPGHRKAVDTIFRDLYKEGRQRGFSKYRSHINYMDLVADAYDFNDHAYRRFVERLKDTVDPNGILSPGKQGIWPAKYRHYREKL
ncbi:FAD binding domain-containing protein [Cladophialophora immunda]|nr:FAD binding domain-containing protein [Cladophialophora immunda]